MQFQADLLGVPVIRPQVAETTSLGAGYAAGLATGFWNEVEDLRENWVEDKRWEPSMDESQRDEYYQYWKKAVTRTFDWFEADQAANLIRGACRRGVRRRSSAIPCGTTPDARPIVRLGPRRRGIRSSVIQTTGIPPPESGGSRRAGRLANMAGRLPMYW